MPKNKKLKKNILHDIAWLIKNIMNTYIVVTEEWYGGGPKRIRTFSSLDLAKSYRQKLIQETNHKLDISIMMCCKNDTGECKQLDVSDDDYSEDEDG